SAALGAPLDDAGWARYFRDACFAYAAGRSPRELPGPALAAWTARLDAELAAGGPANLVARAVREHVVEHPLDLAGRGVAVGMGGSLKRPSFLVVVARNPALD